MWKNYKVKTTPLAQSAMETLPELYVITHKLPTSFAQSASTARENVVELDLEDMDHKIILTTYSIEDPQILSKHAILYTQLRLERKLYSHAETASDFKCCYAKWELNPIIGVSAFSVMLR
ncbi:hypothetical protein VNO77_34321 [Canavalia gladiata]|uniref:Uncharacterized protein n=1 Tax=Canavalia gladiata TaxID=3824 RepID=A0AAN9KEV6_CANGL